MSYSVNWITKVISVPTSDLTLVSGTHYQLNINTFRIEIRRLEANEGLWAAQILEHSNTRVDFAGVDYAPFDEIINGYTVEVTGVATRVDLLASNNNVIDVLIPTGVSVVPSNSAGLQIVSTGSGLDTGQDAKLTNIDSLLSNIEGGMNHDQVMRLLLAAMANKLSGAGTTEVSIRDLGDTKDRIVATVDAVGNRSSVTVDPD